MDQEFSFQEWEQCPSASFQEWEQCPSLSFQEWEQSSLAVQPSASEEKRLGKRPATSYLTDLAIMPPATRQRCENGGIATKSNLEGGENIEEKGEKVSGNEVSNDHGTHIWSERERRKKMRDMFINLHALLPQLPPQTDKSTIIDEAVKSVKTLEARLRNLERKKMERDRAARVLARTNSTVPVTASVQLPLMLPYMLSPPPARQPTREAYIADFGAKSGIFNGSMVPSAPMLPQGRSPGVVIGGAVGGGGYIGGHPALLEPPQCLQTWTTPNLVVSVCGFDAHISVCCNRKPWLLPALVAALEEYGVEVVTAQVATDGFGRMYMIHARASNIPEQYLAGDQLATVQEIFKLAAGEILACLSFP